MTEQEIERALGADVVSRVRARHALAASLNPPASVANVWGKRLWTLANSSFFLWFLSAVGVAYVTRQWDKAEKQKQMVREIDPVYEELRIRLTRFSDNLELNSKWSASDRQNAASTTRNHSYMKNLKDGCEAANTRSDSPDEFRSKNVAGLLDLLRALVEDTGRVPTDCTYLSPDELVKRLNQSRKAWGEIEILCINDYYGVESGLPNKTYFKMFDDRIQSITKHVEKSHPDYWQKDHDQQAADSK